MSGLRRLAKEETAHMLRDLSRALLQPLDLLVLPSTHSKLQVVLIMQPEGKKKKKKKEQ